MRSTKPTHEHCWDDIPWLVNGTLSEAEQKLILEHVEGCAECREELARQRDVHAHLRGVDDVGAPPEAAWQRLLARVDAQPRATSTGMSQPQPQRRWLIAAVWIQGIAIAGLVAALFVSQPTAEYFTLATPHAAVQGTTLRVVFAPDSSIAGVNRVLQDVGGEVIAGPSEAGVYTVAIAEEDPRPTIAALRRRAEILFAEPGASNDQRQR